VLGGALLAACILTVAGSTVWVAAYPFDVALISLTAIFFLHETRDDDLADTRPQERALAATR
jgi:hypothetical protein